MVLSMQTKEQNGKCVNEAKQVKSAHVKRSCKGVFRPGFYTYVE